MAAGAGITGPTWLARYFPVPFVERWRSFAGADCRGLAYLILEHETGRRVPEPEEVYASADPRCPDLPGFVAATLAGAWQPVDAATLWAVHLFACVGVPAHVGVNIGGRSFVHTRRSTGVHVSSLDRRDPGETAWGPRLIGSYAFVG